MEQYQVTLADRLYDVVERLLIVVLGVVLFIVWLVDDHARRND